MSDVKTTKAIMGEDEYRKIYKRMFDDAIQGMRVFWGITPKKDMNGDTFELSGYDKTWYGAGRGFGFMGNYTREMIRREVNAHYCLNQDKDGDYTFEDAMAYHNSRLNEEFREHKRGDILGVMHYSRLYMKLRDTNDWAKYTTSCYYREFVNEDIKNKNHPLLK